jgi:hypothetical protein
MLRDTRVGAALTWVAVQVDRVWRLLPDVWRLLSGCVRTLRWLVVPARPRPGIALLEGEALARPGAASVYRMRVHNPKDAPESLRVIVRGWSDRRGVPAFSVMWYATLAAHGSAEQWLRTSWSGDAALLDRPPRDATLPWTASESQGRWTIEASVAPGRARDRVRIGGTLVR